MRKLLIIFASLPVLALSLVVEDDIPPMLKECYNQHTYSNSLDEQTNCLQKYLFYLFGNSTQQTLVDKNALDWVDSLGRSVHHRLKRQTRYNTYNTYNRYNRYNNRFRRPIPSVDRRRVRKEIRTLTDQERQVFFDAINALKNDKVRFKIRFRYPCWQYHMHSSLALINTTVRLFFLGKCFCYYSGQ